AGALCGRRVRLSIAGGCWHIADRAAAIAGGDPGVGGGRHAGLVGVSPSAGGLAQPAAAAGLLYAAAQRHDHATSDPGLVRPGYRAAVGNAPGEGMAGGVLYRTAAGKAAGRLALRDSWPDLGLA